MQGVNTNYQDFIVTEVLGDIFKNRLSYGQRKLTTFNNHQTNNHCNGGKKHEKHNENYR